MDQTWLPWRRKLAVPLDLSVSDTFLELISFRMKYSSASYPSIIFQLGDQDAPLGLISELIERIGPWVMVTIRPQTHGVVPPMYLPKRVVNYRPCPTSYLRKCFFSLHLPYRFDRSKHQDPWDPPAFEYCRIKMYKEKTGGIDKYQRFAHTDFLKSISSSSS